MPGVYIKFMARPTRYEYPGGIYYIRSRGRGREPIFREEEDRLEFLDILSETVFRFKWLCHSYCLLDDHYHLILETPQGNLSRGMRQVNGLYTQMFNRKYRRRGALFGGRFRSVIFEKARYLLPLHRHMVLNPVRAGLTRSPDSWRWSSHRPILGEAKRPPFLFTRAILAPFSKGNGQRGLKEYKDFIASGERERFAWRGLKFQVFLGSDFFIDTIRRMMPVHKSDKRDKTPCVAIPGEGIFQALAGRVWTSRRERDVLIYQAYVEQGYTLREIADCLGVHAATVSRAVRRVEKRMIR